MNNINNSTFHDLGWNYEWKKMRWSKVKVENTGDSDATITHYTCGIFGIIGYVFRNKNKTDDEFFGKGKTEIQFSKKNQTEIKNIIKGIPENQQKKILEIFANINEISTQYLNKHNINQNQHLNKEESITEIANENFNNSANLNIKIEEEKTDLLSLKTFSNTSEVTKQKTESNEDNINFNKDKEIAEITSKIKIIESKIPQISKIYHDECFIEFFGNDLEKFNKFVKSFETTKILDMENNIENLKKLINEFSKIKERVFSLNELLIIKKSNERMEISHENSLYTLRSALIGVTSTEYRDHDHFLDEMCKIIDSVENARNEMKENGENYYSNLIKDLRLDGDNNFLIDILKYGYMNIINSKEVYYETKFNMNKCWDDFLVLSKDFNDLIKELKEDKKQELIKNAKELMSKQEELSVKKENFEKFLTIHVLPLKDDVTFKKAEPSSLSSPQDSPRPQEKSGLPPLGPETQLLHRLGNEVDKQALQNFLKNQSLSFTTQLEKVLEKVNTLQEFSGQADVLKDYIARALVSSDTSKENVLLFGILSSNQESSPLDLLNSIDRFCDECLTYHQELQLINKNNKNLLENLKYKEHEFDLVFGELKKIEFKKIEQHVSFIETNIQSVKSNKQKLFEYKNLALEINSLEKTLETFFLKNADFIKKIDLEKDKILKFTKNIEESLQYSDSQKLNGLIKELQDEKSKFTDLIIAIKFFEAQRMTSLKGLQDLNSYLKNLQLSNENNELKELVKTLSLNVQTVINKMKDSIQFAQNEISKKNEISTKNINMQSKAIQETGKFATSIQQVTYEIVGQLSGKPGLNSSGDSTFKDIIKMVKGVGYDSQGDPKLFLEGLQQISTSLSTSQG